MDIPHDKGLMGHSDADVATHALMDAILGALALGDIGRHFPDTDPTYCGANSLVLLSHVRGLMDAAGYKIGNIDLTILAQRPKLAPYVEEMRENLATVLGTEIGNISVKATTEEGLGFTGAGLGIATHAVCLLEKKI